MYNMAIERKEINIFLNALEVPFKEVPLHPEVVNGIYTPRSYSYETESYSRLYNCKENREFIFGKLSMWARDMMLAIQYGTTKGNPYTILTFEKMQKVYINDKTYGVRRFDSTVRELLKMGIIDLKNKARGHYWYNPKYFAVGSRMKMYPDNLVNIYDPKKYTKPTTEFTDED